MLLRFINNKCGDRFSSWLYNEIFFFISVGAAWKAKNLLALKRRILLNLKLDFDPNFSCNYLIPNKETILRVLDCSAKTIHCFFLLI